MKVKYIDRTANIAWSPSAHHPIYLAAGTAAQQLDATFSTSASLEIYDLNLSDPSFDMLLKGRITSDYRFHKIAWGCVGMKSSEQSSGVIVGGADGGNILMYDPAKILAGEESLLYHKTNHTGSVHSLDFNKFQECLLASGASDSEIFIWDLNNPSSPMTPGSKAQPSEDVTCVAWNCQVQHILASTFSSKCVVWDLRKNEPIIKVSDPASKLLRYKMVAWHPDVATQLCLASEDDHCPLIQLWDLRFATSPVRNLEQHQKGVLSIAWCPQDPDLLLSCGKDNRILCWNPNFPVEGGEVLCELPTSNQWSFDVAWCPRNPAVIASSSCDGHVCAHSLMSGSQKSVPCSSKIAESFPGSEKIPVQPHIPIQNQVYSQISLKMPPKWLRRPVGGSFAFGGKLVCFSGLASQQYVQQIHGLVKINQVITEPSLLNKVSELETALSSRNIVEFCRRKIESCADNKEQIKWNFLEATFSSTPRAAMLTLLGYNPKEGQESFDGDQNVADSITNLSISASTASGSLSDSAEFDVIAKQANGIQDEPFVINTDTGNQDGLLNRALLRGDIESSVDFCMSEKRWADALVLAQAGGYELFKKTQKLYFQSVVTNSSKLICAVATSSWSSVIKNCEISCWKACFAAILTYAKPEDFAQLCELLGSRLECEQNSAFIHNAALCYISSGNLDRLAELWTKTNGKLNVASIQSLIEQIMVLREAVQHMSGSTPPLGSGAVSSILGQFSALLTAQGNLKSALMYLVDPKERSLAVLRDRILQSLGLKSPYFPFERIDVPKHLPSVETTQASQFRTRQPSIPKEQHLQQSFYQPYKTQQPTQQFQPYNVQPVQSAITHQPLPSYPLSSSVPPSSSYQPTPLPPPPPVSAAGMPHTMPAAPSMPPPPADTPNMYTGKSSTGHHLSQRYPKNLHDPSVYSENLYPGQQYYPPMQMSYGVSSPETNFSQPPVPPSMLQPIGSYSTEQNLNIPYSQSSIPPYSPSPYEYSNVPSGGGGGELPPPASMPMTMPLSTIYNEVKTGWNDPPLPKSSSLAPPQTYQPQSTVTAPFGMDPSMSILQPTSAAPGVYGSSSYAAPPQPQIMQPAPVLEPTPVAPPAQTVHHVQKEKAAIPPQHQIIQDTLEDLRQQCQHTATNPQTRRKLEDVAKKLEILYDQLRDKNLSGAVEDGMHQIVQSIVQSDYSAALTVHSLMVSSANFSEICGFMPSIKVLIQTAIQHNVFLQ